MGLKFCESAIVDFNLDCTCCDSCHENFNTGVENHFELYDGKYLVCCTVYNSFENKWHAINCNITQDKQQQISEKQQG